MFNKYVISTLLVVGVIGSVQAENAAVADLRVATASTAARVSMPRADTKTSTLRSANVEEDLKRTEQRLQVELINALGAIVQNTYK